MKSQHVLGAQLYTVRAFTQDLDNMRQTMKKVADIGYKAVQVSGAGPIPASDISSAAQENGLTIAATHMKWDRFKSDLDGVIEDHKAMRCKHSAIGSLGPEYRTAEGVKVFLDELDPIADRLGAEGITFSYHNHSHELMRYDGRTWLDRLYAESSPARLKAELDVYWLQHGGADPVQWICRLTGRQPLLHLKDMAMGPEKQQLFAEIGEGNMNFPPILQAAREAGVEWYLVEQDQTYGRDPFESLAISYRNLQAMGLS